MNHFVPMRLSLRGNIKLHKLARKLGMTKAAASGHLYWLWASVMEQRTDGNITGWDAQDVAYYAGWEGEEEALLGALLDIGWILQADEELRINDWDEWCALRDAQCTDDDQRKKWREQKKAQRARNRQAKQGLSADSPRTSADSPPERRGEESIGDQDHAAADQPRSVLMEVAEEIQVEDVQQQQQQQQQQQKAQPANLLPARACDVGMDMDRIIAWTGQQGVQPKMSPRLRMSLTKMREASPVTEEELAEAVLRAQEHSGSQPANLGLVIKKIEQGRANAEAAVCATPRGRPHSVAPRDSACLESAQIAMERLQAGEL